MVIPGAINLDINYFSVKLTSFGTFSVKHKKERIGRNPKTKEEAIIDARRVVSFRASKELKRRVDN